MTEYGCTHHRLDNALLEALQKDAGIPHLPTKETYEFRLAVSGEGPLAYQWSDKPHRLLYDACSIIESAAALRQPTQSDALKAAGDAIRGLLDITSDYNLDSEQAGRAYAALHDIDTALKGQSK